jgi:uncharacterized membrane protein
MEAIMPWVEALVRWVHVVAGVLWIGLLYYFNWINGQVAKQLDADTKQKVLPELLPRTLYFFRWGAAYTFITGVLLLGMVYYMTSGSGPMGLETPKDMALSGMAFGVIIVGLIIYDVLWKAMQAKKAAGVAVTYVLLLGVMYVMHAVLGMHPRGLYIHVGALFGTCMAFNVWYRIWPMQRKIIAAIKNGTPTEPGWGAMAGLRSKHNTYMSVPLIYIMVAGHVHPQAMHLKIGDAEHGWIALAVIIALGWYVTSLIYKKSAKPEVAEY